MKSLHVALLLTIASFTVEAQEKQQLPDDLIPYTDEAVETDLSEEELENLAFEIFLQRKFNMTPEQLRKFAEMKKQESEALKRKKPAIPIRTIDSIDLSPGAKPYVIHTTPGWDSHLSIIDASGKPWEIVYDSIGSSEEFTAEKLQTSNNNKIKITGNYRVGSTNLTVGLKGLDELITFELVADKNEYHASLTMQLPKLGPLSSEVPLESHNAMMSNEPYMREILQGGHSLSDDFEKLKTSNSRVNAWKKGEVLFLLTDLTVHGIDPISVRHGPGGFAAYEIAYLPSILFTNDNGTPISVYFQKDNSKYEY